MCGICGYVGYPNEINIQKLIKSLAHRGPDGKDTYEDLSSIGLGHTRLSIIDLSDNGSQPLFNSRRDIIVVLNGEIYNYLELKQELGDYPYKSQTDTEVLLAAYEKWGIACLDKLIGMFAFAIWDVREQQLFLARDRFGVKPIYYSTLSNGSLVFASEIKTLFEAGVRKESDLVTWATYLNYGLYENGERTFWKGITKLLPGHAMIWREDQQKIWQWYDISKKVGADDDLRDDNEVSEEYLALLKDSIRLRLRSDVPIGINLSGGLDSSLLLGLIKSLGIDQSLINAYTFVTGNPDYDELPWVEEMVGYTNHHHFVVPLSVQEIPDLAVRVQRQQDEPYGGIPTLAYSKIFGVARQQGTIVLLDGNGVDEQWAGYDYYRNIFKQPINQGPITGPVQGSKSRATRPECLNEDFIKYAETWDSPAVFSDPLKNMQLSDIMFRKIPRALRFNDRISMMHHTELREPFLDHRLFELALRQPVSRKINQTTGKLLPRQIAERLMPGQIANAPKRPVQTPQREWLRNELSDWAYEMIFHGFNHIGQGWLKEDKVTAEYKAFQRGEGDNSNFIWQWLTIGLMSEVE